MIRPRPKTSIIREERVVEFEIPEYLRSSWKCHENTRFAEIIESLKTAFSQPIAEDAAKDVVLGFKEVFHFVSTRSLSVLCVVACTDNGQEPGVTARLVQTCFESGIPVILGRGPRLLGSVFEKKRVGCVALTKQAVSRSELLDFVINLSAITSPVEPALGEVEEIQGKWLSGVVRRGRTDTEKRKATEAPPRKDDPKKAKAAVTPPNGAKKKIPQKNNGKKGDFFSSFN